MKWKSDLSRLYMPTRILPYLTPDLKKKVTVRFNSVSLVRPKIKLIRRKNLEITQRISYKWYKDEYYIVDSLEGEAYQLFDNFKLERVTVTLEYE